MEHYTTTIRFNTSLEAKAFQRGVEFADNLQIEVVDIREVVGGWLVYIYDASDNNIKELPE
jgi:hypothetical protein